jgi:hypothetical protein
MVQGMRWGSSVGVTTLISLHSLTHLSHSTHSPLDPPPPNQHQALAGRHYNEALHGLLTAAGSTPYLVDGAHRTLVLHEVLHETTRGCCCCCCVQLLELEHRLCVGGPHRLQPAPMLPAAHTPPCPACRHPHAALRHTTPHHIARADIRLAALRARQIPAWTSPSSTWQQSCLTLQSPPASGTRCRCGLCVCVCVVCVCVC